MRNEWYWKSCEVTYLIFLIQCLSPELTITTMGERQHKIKWSKTENTCRVHTSGVAGGAEGRGPRVLGGKFWGQHFADWKLFFERSFSVLTPLYYFKCICKSFKNSNSVFLKRFCSIDPFRYLHIVVAPRPNKANTR